MKTIAISGVIGWDFTAADLREALQEAAGADVQLNVSSPGGFVSTGLEMYNLIRNYSGQTTARLSGYAMSIASYFPLAADRIVAEDNAIYMIHNVRGGIYGDHNDILNYGSTTKGMSRMIAKAYAKRTGKPLEEIEQMMDAETYLFGEDMVSHGFVDEMITTEEEKDPETARAMACVALQECTSRMSADISAVKKDLANAAVMLGTMTASGDKSKTQKKKKETVMNVEQLKTEHPELHQALLDEGRTLAAADQAAALETVRAEAAAGERQRITDCLAQAIPGHEALVNRLALDGSSTAGDVALAIIGAEKALRSSARQALEDDAPPAAPPAEGEGGTTTPPADDSEASAQARFEASGDLQKEFGGNFKAYFAYVKANSSGRARILGK